MRAAHAARRLRGKGFAVPSSVGGGGGSFDNFAETIPGWPGTRTFYDNFPVNVAEGSFLNNAAYSGRWDAAGASGLYYMTNQSGTFGDRYGGGTNLSVVNNELILNCFVRQSDGVAIGCAPIPKPGGNYYQTFGRYAVEFRCLENLSAWKVAWLLWPQNTDNASQPWPTGGEHDFLEGNLNSTMGAFHHWYLATSGGQQDPWDSHVNFGTGTHTVVTHWAPNFINVEIDGIEIGRRDASTPNGGTSKIVPNPMRCVLQTEIAQIGGPGPTYPSQQRIAISKIAIHNYTG